MTYAPPPLPESQANNEHATNALNSLSGLQPKKSKKPLIIGIAAGAVLLATAAITIPLVLANNARSTQFKDAADECLIGRDAYTVMDDGNSIEFSGATLSYGASGEEVFCFLKELEAPESLETKIGQTRSLDGTREATWGDFAAQWTYHPDSGLNLLIERNA
ncbi:hypothetical protein [Leucobacter luti]|uniref:hypothetical protein n=1 Tax=Leucobacter luti TaxID=340320 RepID=UPI001C68B693|nr:hypothetical protein [Leucobacter luti]QYM76918.1 hypothetical protein K1X41_05950 [Leucobacter luti]